MHENPAIGKPKLKLLIANLVTKELIRFVHSLNGLKTWQKRTDRAPFREMISSVCALMKPVSVNNQSAGGLWSIIGLVCLVALMVVIFV